MISSISFTAKAILLLTASLVVLAGCTTAGNGVGRSTAADDIPTPLLATAPVAVLPLENLSGTSAPLQQIREALRQAFQHQGFATLADKTLADFMARHRVRYTGGIDGDIARAFKEETGAGAILITAVELYDDRQPPRIALTSRLVSAARVPAIVWMDSIALAGDDAPGLLGLGLIEDPRVLVAKALRALAGSCARTLLAETAGGGMGRRRKALRPKAAFRSAAVDPAAPYTLAVLPFVNEGFRRHAGEIMKLHLVREMTTWKKITVIEPGVVRKALLNYRIIMAEGLSLADAAVVWVALDADLLLTGKVLDYQDYQGAEGAPAVDFSLQMLARTSGEVVWASKSYNRGTDGVYFFDLGRERTAHAMASRMARMVGEMMWK